MRTETLTANFRDLKRLEHYLMAAYGSTESHFQRVVVVDPSVDEPTALLRPRCQVLKRSNILALLVPSTEAITAEVAHQVTGVVTDYVVLRRFPAEFRRAGIESVSKVTNIPLTVDGDCPDGTDRLTLMTNPLLDTTNAAKEAH